MPRTWLFSGALPENNHKKTFLLFLLHCKTIGGFPRKCILAYSLSAFLNAVQIFAANPHANHWFPPQVVFLCPFLAQKHHKKSLFLPLPVFGKGAGGWVIA